MHSHTDCLFSQWFPEEGEVMEDVKLNVVGVIPQPAERTYVAGAASGVCCVLSSPCVAATRMASAALARALCIAASSS